MTKANGNGRAKKRELQPAGVGPATKITSAAEYLEIVEKEEATPTTFTVPMPSGAVFLLRIPDITGYAMTGRMPQALTSEFLQAAEARGVEKLSDLKKQVEQMAEEISISEARESLIFVREIVREAVVAPRFGEKPGEIPYSKFKTEDFKFVFDWVLKHSGVAGLAGLQSFRSRRERRASSSRANRKKLRGAPVGTSKHKVSRGRV